MCSGLDDLCVRFIVNLPYEELQEAERICFQIEEAQWFYEDFIRPSDPENLPSLNLRNFYMLISRHCPLLSDFPAEAHDEAFQSFLAYKTRVPVRGAIMLNDNMDEVVLVKGWKKNANWSFPRGKINKEEADLDCAIREVYEETGYDLKAAGLVPDENHLKSIEVIMREQHMKLFVFRNIPKDTHFEPRTRKEISKIQWYKLSELPTVKKNKQHQDTKSDTLAGNANKFYMVAPFLGHLKKWIAQQRRQDKARSTSQPLEVPAKGNADIPTDTEDQKASGGNAEDPAFAKILTLLRKPEKTEPSDLPEVSLQDSKPKRSDPPILELNSVSSQENQAPNKDDLLALLWSGRPRNGEEPPQTPAAQVIEEPKMPHSPLHHHLSRIPTGPMMQDSSSVQHSDLAGEVKPPNIPGLRPAPPMTQPGRLVQISGPSHRKKVPRPGANNRAVPAPYQLTGDQFVNDAAASGGEQSAIPQASELPPPKVTPHSAKLLSLFKTKKSTDEASKPAENPAEKPKTESLPQKSSTSFVPSQIPPGVSTQNLPPKRPMSGQQASLLNLFRTPSASAQSSAPDQSPLLQPPSPLVELSAVPTPGHSREPSQARSPPQQAAKIATTKSPVTIKKRPNPSTSPLPVSATISGPLNVPQFEAVAHKSRPKKLAAHDQSKKPEKNPSITILPRPGSSHAPSKAETSTASASTSLKPQPRGTVDKARSPSLTPVKIPQPPTPNLEARPDPPKGFHPQILRRSGRQPENDEPSPIQALPSPRHKIHGGKTVQSSSSGARVANDDHKKSLLSLFTNAAPSPIVSPPSAPLAEGETKSALISPLGDVVREDSKRPAEQRDSSMPPPASTDAPWQQQRQQENKQFRVPEPLALSKAVKMNTTAVESAPNTEPESNASTATLPDRARDGSGGALGSGKQTPIETRDKLLGYLANIKA